MRIEVVSLYDVALLRQHRDKVFVFGDNLLRSGKAGQAVIRSESNAFGVPTKRLPSMGPGAFFSDRPDEREAVLAALRSLYALGQSRIVVFPSAGLGTGLAQMARHSPSIYREMTQVLKQHFGYVQGLS